jgi:flavin reductase (DIM6/NTAB) family NADH-FMN oxidoreductase RutF
MTAECIDTGSSTSQTVELSPKILYMGTPVVLVSTMNENGTPNLAPMSSAWALGWTMVLGLGRSGQTLANLERSGECVLNFPSDSLWEAVESIAPLTGRNPPAERVLAYGGRFEPLKFEAAGLTPRPSHEVAPPRVMECPIQLEARLRAVTPLADEPEAAAAEVRVVRVHAHEEIVMPNGRHIDPESWHPLIYSFRHYFGLGDELGRSFRSETR